MEGPQFRQELSQQLKLCPQLMQNIALLQMNVQDLREFLERAVEENPMLEQREPSGDAFRELSARNEWMRTSSDAPPEPGAEDRELTSRESFLRDQLARRKLPPKLLSLCTYLIERLDEDGFLPPEELEHLHHLGLPAPMPEEALAAVQALEPAGIAARSLSECLLLQLRRSGQETPLLTELVSHHLEPLARQQYGPLAHLLHCSKAEVENAAAQIAQLDPHPGRWDAPASEPVQYIQPDAYVLDENGALSVVLNDFYLPHLALSSQYEEMMHSADAETASYLRRACKQAQELLSGLSRRGKTLHRCLEAVVSTQAPFFLLPDGVLSPMTRRTLAESLGLNPSTITRALKGKYLQCRRGIYPLSAFFFSARRRQFSAGDPHPNGAAPAAGADAQRPSPPGASGAGGLSARAAHRVQIPSAACASCCQQAPKEIKGVFSMNYTDLTAYRKSNPFMDFCGIEAVRAEHDDCEVKMTITATDKNTHGFVHGSLLFTLADCVAGLTARSDGRNYVTQSAHINFIKNLTEGTIHAYGTTLSRGRTIVIIRVQIKSEDGRLLADGTVDMFCVK